MIVMTRVVPISRPWPQALHAGGFAEYVEHVRAHAVPLGKRLL